MTKGNMQPLVKVENLDVIYFLGKSNQVNALTKINAEIYPGEFVIFFGPSGCGKSTLLNSIAGLEQATHGNVFVGDRNLTKFNQKELEEYRQKKIGMIFQAYYLINSLSVLKNVTLPQLSLNSGIKEREEKATKLLEHFGIAQQAQKIPAELSGGQQQRVAISRSLINNPEMILADEPTGNLDSKSDFDVMELLREMNSKDKKTVILVTHSPTHLHYANRVFFMKDGAIIDTKVNRALYISEQAGVTATGTQPLMNKDLELLTKAFATLTNATADQLIPIKAQEIVTESLTDMTAEEMTALNKKVEVMLTKRLATTEEIFRYLDEDEAKGGLAMNKLQAQKLADKITKIVAEIKVLESKEKGAMTDQAEDAEVKEIRQYLFDVFDIKVASPEAVWNVNLAIKARLENKISGAELQKKFDLPVTQGGAGMDKRAARHAARRLELLILGKYNPDKKDKQPPPKMPPASTQGGPTTKSEIPNPKSETNSKLEIQNKPETISAKSENPGVIPNLIGDPKKSSWIPAFAGMTKWGKGMTERIKGMTRSSLKNETGILKLTLGQRLTLWWKRVLSNLPLSHNAESMGLDPHFRGDEKKKVIVVVKEKLFNTLKIGSEKMINLTMAINRTLRKTILIPTQLFYWLRKNLNKIFKQ